jgi:hypothetical protein
MLRLASRVESVGAARDISEHVPHEIVDALIPFQGGEIVHVGKGRALVTGVARNLVAARPGQRGANVKPDITGDAGSANRQLTAQHRRLERIGWQEAEGVGARMQPCDDGCIVLQLLAAAGICLEVNIDGGETPAGLSRHGGKTAHAARQPEADAASIRFSRVRG